MPPPTRPLRKKTWPLLSSRQTSPSRHQSFPSSLDRPFHEPLQGQGSSPRLPCPARPPSPPPGLVVEPLERVLFSAAALSPLALGAGWLPLTSGTRRRKLVLGCE